MSEIPFVKALGDALEGAIAAPAPSRRRAPRRRLVLGLAGAVVFAAGGLAVAALLDSPEKLAANSVGCYDSASLDANVSVPNGVGAPLAQCAAVYESEHQPVPPLVACVRGSVVAVFPGSGEAVCRGLGLSPLPAGYATAREKVGTLERDVIALEKTADCIAPAELARRVDALLARTGWVGWHTQLRLDVSQGPCGSVTGLGGDGRESIAGSLDADHRVVMIFGAPHRSTEALLYGAGTGLAPKVEDASGGQCYSVASLEAYVRGAVAPTGRAVSFTVTTGRPAGEEFGDARAGRYQADCAVLTDLRPAADGLALVGAVLHRG